VFFYFFAVKLRCSGVQPDDNPVKSELVSYFTLLIMFLNLTLVAYSVQDRVELYQDKLERLLDLNKGIFFFFSFSNFFMILFSQCAFVEC
jgi:hypothetical protein